MFSGFRYVKHILLLVCLFEWLFATEHILEEIFLEEVMHYSTITNASLCLPVWVGNVAGCLFSLWWLQKVMRMSYIRLGIVFMASLHDVIDFNHFFQGLSVFNMIHMVIGGCMGCALYAKLLGTDVADSFMRFTSPALWMHNSMPIGTPSLVGEMLLCGVKSLYGWACYGCLALVIGFLLFDSPIRRHRSYMLPWRLVGMALSKYYKLSNQPFHNINISKSKHYVKNN